MAVVWKEFRNFNNSKSLRHNVKHVPRNFDQIFNYLNALLFEKNNIDFEKEYDGRAWLGVLFIHA